MLKNLGIVLLIVGVCCLFFCKKTKTQSMPETLIVFNNTGNVSEYVTTGFSAPEKTFTWTSAKEATIAIPLPKLQDDYGFSLVVKMGPFLGNGNLKKQVVDVFVNDKLTANWVVEKFGAYRVVLPKEVKTQGDTMNVKFVISNPKSPKELNISADMRKLGVAVQSVSLVPFDLNNPNEYAEYDIGKEISFVKGGNSSEYVGAGWSQQEQGFTWTDGKDAYLNVFVKDAKDKQLQLNVYCSAIYGQTDNHQKVTVYVNGTELTTWEVVKENKTYAVKLPESVVQNGALQIRLHINKPIKVGQDPRSLGMGVNAVKISQIFAAKTKNKMANWFKNKVLDSEAEQQTENNK